ncbi:hypothetical protein NUW58_g6209 [Xylaria curta]|uniref:Uncharacterized protein n=1 Tax=Xylaria curta TaxID=42375 RepID=A0ACC1NX04_9PEZI|nr:hypothetical protein NUW58_g6209 [Xylaria curta]
MAQQPALTKPWPEMMRDYLAKGPATATERLVAQSGDTIGTITSIAAAEKLCFMETYLDRLVEQARGGGSHRGSTSSTESQTHDG